MRLPGERVPVALLLSAGLGLAASRAQACSPDWSPVYAFTQYPGTSRQELLTGKLGLISGRWDDATLFVAFRQLEGLPMSAASQAALGGLWEAAATAPAFDAQGAWRAAVSRAGGTPPGWLPREREEPAPGGYTYGYYLNCLDDALSVAARTLDERVARYGRGSRETAAWLEGQNTVFQNCGRGDSEPPELDASFDARLRADRSYQRAAAAFYAGRHAVAEERFKAIAADPASEWSGLAGYLVARSQLRAGKLSDSESTLQAVLADATRARWHSSARGLLRYVAARLHPEEREAELAERLFGPELAAPLRQDLVDYLWLNPSPRPSRSARSQEFREWLAALRAESESEKQRAVARFLERPSSLARLVAALGVRPFDPAVGERIEQAARQVPPSSPAYLAVSYRRALRLAESGRHADARTLLDGLLAAPDSLSASDRNALRRLRATVAESLPEFVRYMLMPRVGDSFDGMEGPLSHFPPRDPGLDELPPEALYVLNSGVPPQGWAELARTESVPAHWRRLLTLSGFARAVVDGDEDMARAFAQQASALDPRVAEDLRGYLEAREADERRFAAAWSLLRRPAVGYDLGLRFGAPEELDRFRGNWWCGGSDVTVPGSSYRPRFLGDGPALTRRVPAQPAAVFLGDLVLDHARRRPGDARVPEALHGVVRATRFGCGLGENGRVSRAAFELLHRRYPASEWTRRTPYWFK